MTGDPMAETMQRLIRRICGEYHESSALPCGRSVSADDRRGCFARLTDGVFAVSSLGRAGQGGIRSDVRDRADTWRVFRAVRRTRSIP